MTETIGNCLIFSDSPQAKLVLGGLSLGQCVKVPFVLLPPENADPDPYPQLPGQVSSCSVAEGGGEGVCIGGEEALNNTASTSQDLGAFPYLRITTATVTPCATANASPELSTARGEGRSGSGKNSTKRLTSDESSIITVSNASGGTSSIPPSNVPTASSHPDASTSSGSGRVLESLRGKKWSKTISENTEGKEVVDS